MNVVARKSNGAGENLEQAMALLIQNQAAFLPHLTETYARLSRIESDLDQIKAIVLRHETALNGLSEAIRQKIGFRPGSRAAPAS